jgi:hypothetical protein
MLSKFLGHLKDKGHAWVIGLSILTVAGYLWYAIATKQSEQQLIANTVLALVSAVTVFSSIIAVFVLASLKKTEFGELLDFKAPLIIGVVAALAVTTIQLLSLFGVLKFAR